MKPLQRGRGRGPTVPAKRPRRAEYPVGGATSRAVVEVLRELQDSLDEPWTVDAMARRAGYGVSHFAHAFQAIVGVSPLLYLRSLRLERAAHDLVFTPEKDLFTIGRDAGYASSEAFRRAFVKAFGRAPSAIRRAPGRGSTAQAPAVTAERLGLPEGVGVRPEIVRFGPVSAVSLRAASFSPDAIADAWRRMFGLVPPAEPWELGAATSPWGFAVQTSRREYRCLHLGVGGRPSIVPPLEPWRASAGWHARMRFHGSHAALQSAMDWMFGAWLPASALRWRFAPVITLFDNRVWRATAFREALCDVHVPIRSLGRGVYAPP